MEMTLGFQTDVCLQSAGAKLSPETLNNSVSASLLAEADWSVLILAHHCLLMFIFNYKQ